MKTTPAGKKKAKAKKKPAAVPTPKDAEKWATTDLEYEIAPTRPDKITYAASGLTTKQENFCLKYVETGNASGAYRHAYDASGMLPATVNKRASELAAHGEVKGRIDELKQQMLEKHHVTRERILREYARIGFMDIRNAFTEEGGLKAVTELDEDTAAAINSIEVDDLYEGYGDDRRKVGVTQKVKFHNKLGALDAMAKVLNINPSTRLEITGKDGEALKVQDVTPLDLARRVAFMLAQGAEAAQKNES